MTSIDDRIITIHYRATGDRQPCQCIRLNDPENYAVIPRDDFDWLIDQLREHRQVHTLVECSKCGKGYRVREMGQVGAERVCVSCLADALTGSYALVKTAQEEARHYQDMIGPLRDALASVKDGFVDASRLDPDDYQYFGVGLVYPEVVAAVHAALNGAGDE